MGWRPAVLGLSQSACHAVLPSAREKHASEIFLIENLCLVKLSKVRKIPLEILRCYSQTCGKTAFSEIMTSCTAKLASAAS